MRDDTQLKFDIEVNFGVLYRVIALLDREIPNKIDKFMDFIIELGKETEETFKQIIDEQGGEYAYWSPPSPSKIGDELYKETDTLYNAITHEILKEKKQRFGGKRIKTEVEVGIGVRRNKIHTPSGLDYEDLFAYLEFGAPHKNLPPRPLNEPTNRITKKKIDKELEDIFG